MTLGIRRATVFRYYRLILQCSKNLGTRLGFFVALFCVYFVGFVVVFCFSTPCSDVCSSFYFIPSTKQWEKITSLNLIMMLFLMQLWLLSLLCCKGTSLSTRTPGPSVQNCFPESWFSACAGACDNSFSGARIQASRFWTSCQPFTPIYS